MNLTEKRKGYSFTENFILMENFFRCKSQVLCRLMALTVCMFFIIKENIGNRLRVDKAWYGSFVSCLLMICILFPLAAVSCAVEEEKLVPEEGSGTEKRAISISGSISQEYITRANDGGFCDKDVVGVYISDYKDNVPGELLDNGNHVDNLRFTYDEGSNRWIPAYEVYWKDNKTDIDIYGYYPYGDPASVSEYPFEVAKDQRTETENGRLGGYESSDFLWGKSSGIAPTSSVIRLGFTHRMSCVRIRLNRGFGFSESEWETAQKEVVILNTARKSLIDLKAGVVKPYGYASGPGIIPYKSGDEYRGIVVPQSVGAGKNLISVTVDGESYFLKKNEDFVYVPSRMHNFTITVNKRSQDVGLDFVLSAESITAWENDNISHDAAAREYVIVDVKEPGTLDRRISESGKNIANVKNLKVTGRINSRDFAIMNFMMPSLSALNLKEAVIVKGEYGVLGGGEMQYFSNGNDEIPQQSFAYNKTLSGIVFPDRLRKIGDNAFMHCENLTGSIIIPEGVDYIGWQAFFCASMLDGELSLPSTLKNIRFSAFGGCGFSCELKLPEGLECIENEAFSGCINLYGNLRLPGGLKILGEAAFSGCYGFTGGLEIPQGLRVIGVNTFADCGFDGTLKLHDGIESIKGGAFLNCSFRGELVLPDNLQNIGANAFRNNMFSGVLYLPEMLTHIGEGAFFMNRGFKGELVIPSNLRVISNSAFEYCDSLEGLVFGSGLESIGVAAFDLCVNIRRIKANGNIVPKVKQNAFEGIPKDVFTVEVPETALHDYQTAEGWREFKYISPHRNFTVIPNSVSAINASVTRNIELDSESGWFVEKQPEWVTLSQTSGVGKTDLTLTFSRMPQGNGTREGEVVFALKDKDVRIRCNVAQYDYKYEEDDFITLQKASMGGGVNIVLLGDGYSAEEVSKGKLAGNLEEACLHFFDIEPYRTYKDYFNVYMAVSVSEESGIGGVNTFVDNKFNTCVKENYILGGRNGDSDYRYVADYICGNSGLDPADIDKTLVIMIPNTGDYSGVSYMWDEGFAISYCPVSTYKYPYDFRGVIQHEAGGHGFGKLGDESSVHNSFIDECRCTCCGHLAAFNASKAKGWYENLSLSGKMSSVPWSHLFGLEKYKAFIDVYEGGFMHGRGVYRSEKNSCMNNSIPYYNTISRESIVKRIKSVAGEEFSFDDFFANDKTDVARSFLSAELSLEPVYKVRSGHNYPVLMGSMEPR